MNKESIIVTFQNAYNYGAVLQCFALQEVIKNFNIDVSVLNYDNHFFKSKKPMSNIKYNISSIIHLNRMLKRNRSYKNFISKNINLTKLMTYKEIKQLNLNSNTILISGSDQVWNTDLTNGFDDIYFLNFGNNAKKISYAASIGKTDIDSKYIEKIKNALSNFIYISVREKTGQKVLKNLTDLNVDVVLDPTFLLTKIEWQKYISSKQRYNYEYILVYMPNEDIIKIVTDLVKDTNLKVINLAKKKSYGKYEINRFDANPFEFIELVKNAKYIITTSFHATAFSIVFNKPFWVIPPKNVSSRITDLLQSLQLDNRILKNYDDYFSKKCKSIDYTYANKVIQKEREKSICKLQNILNERD